MAIQRISRSFKDISLSFDRHPVTNDINILKNENAIKRSVRNLVQTIPTERFFNPLLGSQVRRSLFDFVDFGTASVIQSEIETTLENFEERVEIHPIDPSGKSNVDSSYFYYKNGDAIVVQCFFFSKNVKYFAIVFMPSLGTPFRLSDLSPSIALTRAKLLG